MSIVFRRAVLADAAGINVLIASLAHYRAVDLSVPAPASFLDGFSEQMLRRNLGDPGYACLVAVRDERIVGVLGIREARRINHFFVSQTCQGQGIGRQLWQLACDESLLNFRKPLTVNSSLAAAPVYERFGFLAGSAVHEPGLSYVPMQRPPIDDVRDQESEKG